MFIRQIAERVFVYNDDMDIINEYDDAKFYITDSRIRVVSKENQNNIFCDMPIENTSILYK